MLQSILQNLIPTLQNAVLAIIPLVMLLALLSKQQPENLKKWIWRGIQWGMLGVAFIVTVKLGTKAVTREVYEGLVLTAGLLGEALLLGLFWWNQRRGTLLTQKLLGGMICLVTTTLILYHGLEFILFPINLLVSSTALVSIDFLIKFIGFLLGILLAAMTGLAIFRAARVLPAKAILMILTLQFAALMLKQVVAVIQVMMLRKMLATSKGLMAAMSFLLNHQAGFLYLLLAVTLILPVVLFLQRRPPKPANSNPAQYRKILVALRNQLQWGTAVIFSVLVVFLCSTFGTVYADKKAEIVPAVSVTAEQGLIGIPLEKVEDGHLHRFAYLSSTGITVRFIVIKKSGSAYGVGLDACEICGPTGYFERDGQVVCKLCDVVMNTATIGFKGGCNPIPIEYKVAEGKVMVSAAGLEKEQDRFK
jgi:uncharacterized membrane protein